MSDKARVWRLLLYVGLSGLSVGTFRLKAVSFKELSQLLIKIPLLARRRHGWFLDFL